jgi:hypothetical protein
LNASWYKNEEEEQMKKGERMRKKGISVLAALCFMLSMQVGSVYAEGETAKFKVIDTAFCPDIEAGRRWCESSDVEFPADVGKIYCCTKIAATEDGEIYHRWIFEGEEMASVKLNILRSGGFRTRSYKTVFPNQAGNWKVEVVADGEVIVSLPITITPSKESPAEESAPASPGDARQTP